MLTLSPLRTFQCLISFSAAFQPILIFTPKASEIQNKKKNRKIKNTKEKGREYLRELKRGLFANDFEDLDRAPAMLGFRVLGLYPYGLSGFQRVGN